MRIITHLRTLTHARTHTHEAAAHRANIIIKITHFCACVCAGFRVVASCVCSAFFLYSFPRLLVVVVVVVVPRSSGVKRMRGDAND